MYEDLVIDKIELQMAQYIPHHRTCGVLHGHTYVITDLHILVHKGAFLDFGLIKELFKNIDHRQFFPEADRPMWNKVFDICKEYNYNVRFNPIWLKESTVECISDYLVQEIRTLNEPIIVGIKFKITEGNHQGVEKSWGRVK